MRNLLITMMDALRYDAILQHTGGGDTGNNFSARDRYDPELPELERLANEGTLVSNLRTSHLSAEPSTASLLTGCYPREHHLYGPNRLLHPEVKSFVEYFSDEGFHTLLFNGHHSYISNGLMARFDENLVGPIDRLLNRIKELNQDGRPVFVFYEPLDLRVPYLLSKFPPDKTFHNRAIVLANELAEGLALEESFEGMEAHYMTGEWQIPLAGGRNLPVWRFFMNTIHEHFQHSVEPFEDPVESLADYYWQTLELIDEYHFNTLYTFLTDHEVGQRTTLFLTSNSGHGPTRRNDRDTFGSRTKPIEDAARVPGLLFNNQKSLPATSTEKLSSHVDVAPTLLDEFGLGYDSDEFSGRSLLKSPDDNRRIFVESASVKGSPDMAGHYEVPGPSVVQWTSLLNDRGYKVYRRWLPVTKRDLQLPLPEFFRRIIAKLLREWLNDDEAEERADKLSGEDTFETRQQVVRNIKQQIDENELEVFNWKNDPGEDIDLLDDLDPSLKPHIEGLVDDLTNRFDDPHELNTPEPPQGTHESVEFIEPLDAVGYVE